MFVELQVSVRNQSCLLQRLLPFREWLRLPSPQQRGPGPAEGRVKGLGCSWAEHQLCSWGVQNRVSLPWAYSFSRKAGGDLVVTLCPNRHSSGRTNSSSFRRSRPD